VKWFEQNVAALDITLPPGELFVLDPLASQVTGARYRPSGKRLKGRDRVSRPSAVSCWKAFQTGHA
jgi:hypothetical protein